MGQEESPYLFGKCFLLIKLAPLQPAADFRLILQFPISFEVMGDSLHEESHSDCCNEEAEYF